MNPSRLGLLVLTTVLSFSGCASLHSVALTNVPKDRSKPIEAEGSTWAILGIYFSNSFADEAITGLREKCPNGKVSGVFTKYENRFYFLWTTRTVKASAFCEGVASNSAGSSSAGSRNLRQ